MTNYIFAGLILLVWTILVIYLGWDEKLSPVLNIIDAILITVMFGVIYWVPFWLIFLK